MPKKKSTNEQIAFALRQAGASPFCQGEKKSRVERSKNGACGAPDQPPRLKPRMSQSHR